jgi:hypothetical protein
VSVAHAGRSVPPARSLVGRGARAPCAAGHRSSSRPLLASCQHLAQSVAFWHSFSYISPVYCFRRVAPPDRHFTRKTFAFPKKEAKVPRRLAPRLGIAWHARQTSNRDSSTSRCSPDSKSEVDCSNGWKAVRSPDLATAAAPTTGDNNVGECWGGRARSLSLRGMGVVGVTDNDGSVWACRNRRAGDALHAHRGVDAVCSQLR